MHLIRALGKSTSFVCFSPYMKRNIYSFVSFKKSQHTTTGGKKSKICSHKETKPTMRFSHLHLTQSLGAFFPGVDVATGS